MSAMHLAVLVLPVLTGALNLTVAALQLRREAHRLPAPSATAQPPSEHGAELARSLSRPQSRSPLSRPPSTRAHS